MTTHLKTWGNRCRSLGLSFCVFLLCIMVSTLVPAPCTWPRDVFQETSPQDFFCYLYITNTFLNYLILNIFKIIVSCILLIFKKGAPYFVFIHYNFLNYSLNGKYLDYFIFSFKKEMQWACFSVLWNYAILYNYPMRYLQLYKNIKIWVPTMWSELYETLYVILLRVLI